MGYVMNRKTVANVIGVLSIISSSLFWIELALGVVMGRVPGWINVGVIGWVVGMISGLLLAGIATFLWPKRWWLLLVPVISFLAVLVVAYLDNWGYGRTT